MTVNLGQIVGDIGISLLRVAFASGLSWITALSAGILLHKYKSLYKLFLPLLNFFRQISPFIWLPFAILLLGLGELPIAVVLWVALFFPGVIMVYETIEGFPKDVYEEALTSGAGAIQMLLKIELPILWKQLVDIFRIQWAIGWSTVIAAEMLGVSRGLGFRLLDLRYLLEYRMMIIYILIIGAIGILSDYLIRTAGRIEIRL